jgi:hypothetical protein
LLLTAIENANLRKLISEPAPRNPSETLPEETLLLGVSAPEGLLFAEKCVLT